MKVRRGNLLEVGALRTRKKFLFKPMTIGNQTHWLTMGEWQEKSNGRTWTPVKWIHRNGK